MCKGAAYPLPPRCPHAACCASRLWGALAMGSAFCRAVHMCRCGFVWSFGGTMYAICIYGACVLLATLPPPRLGTTWDILPDTRLFSRVRC